MTNRAIVLTFALCSVLPPSASYADDAKALLQIPKTTATQRREYIRKARVWEATDVSAKDLYNGPAGRLSFTVDEEVRCDFVPKPVSGWSEKFLCRLEDGTIVLIGATTENLTRRSSAKSWARVSSGRWVSTRIGCSRSTTCRGCPEHPYHFVDARKKLPVNDEHLIESFPLTRGSGPTDRSCRDRGTDRRRKDRRERQTGVAWKSLKQVDESQGEPQERKSTPSSCSMRSFRIRTIRRPRIRSPVREPHSTSATTAA